MKQASLLEAAGFPPEGRIFPVRSLDLMVLDGSHPWHCAHKDEIAENWIGEIAANPKLFDGQMVFQHQLSFDDGRIEGLAYMVPFSAFLYWRNVARGAGSFHLLALPLILSSDDAVIAIRMAQNTANPGRVYCAAGSLDAQDVVEGRCDLDRNMRREVLEETGLDLAEVAADPHYHALHAVNTVAVFRIFRFPMTADRILDRIATHIAGETDPEITAALAIRDADPARHDYAFFMPPILKWLFDR